MKKDKKSLGTLEKVALRDFWEDEARDFTPWLAEEENLAALSEAIGMELELVGTEQWVGDFKLDILAKDTLTNRYVVIENQLEKTNHSHPGQLLTYASGKDATAVVWISKQLCDEHRKTLDWLNERTTDDVGFFGLEVELWKIGGSNPAPKFNVVSRPNDWARAMNPSGSYSHEPSSRALTHLQFWQELVENLESTKTFLSLQKPRAQHWYEIRVGRSNFHISLTLNSKKNRIGCELYISGQTAKIAFSKLLQQKTAIEKELGYSLEWNELPERGASRIVLFQSGDYENIQERPALIKWMRERAESFHKAFSKRVQELDLEDEEVDAA